LDKISDVVQKKRIKVIANPFSGTGKKDNIRQLLDHHLNQDRYSYDLEFTQFAGHARILAEAAVSENFYMCVAAGGDGTVNEVASVLKGTEVILAVLPYGSGNGFAAHIGVKRDVIRGIEIINTGEVHCIDSCMANDRFFLNIAGIGLDATVAYKTKANKKRGFLPYFTTTLKESLDFKYMDLEIETGHEKFSGSYAMVVVANASIYGYDFTIAPTADLEDGMLDILMVKKSPVYKYFLMALRVLNKSFHKSPLVRFMRVKSITIKSLSKAYIHVDGEGFEADPITTFSVHPSSIRVMFPGHPNG
jgi:YegS/Rv2252/BmrU family lipid kinase